MIGLAIITALVVMHGVAEIAASIAHAGWGIVLVITMHFPQSYFSGLGWRAVVIERRDSADRYRTTSTTAATQLERIAQVSYDAGERGILELLDAFRGGTAARTRQTVLDAAVRQAEIELEFVSGWEMQ